MLQDDKQFFKERGFGKKLGLGENPCLVVIDAMVGFTNPDLPMGYKVDTEIENINRLIDVAREINMPVIFTTIEYRDSLIESAMLWRSKMQGLNSLKTGSEAVNLDPRLKVEPQDDIISKKYASAFFGTEFISLINTAGIDTIIVTGFTTSGCVRATVVDAVQYGYRPIVVRDAVGDRSQASHEQSLFDIEQKYGDVLSTDELIEKLSVLQKG